MNKSVSCSDIIGGSDGDYCTDATGSGGGQNTSGIYLYNDTNTHYFNDTHADINLGVNSSDYWDGRDSANTTHFEQNSGVLTIVHSWLRTFFDDLFATKTTDDLTQGSTNLYDNTSWNESKADDKYADNSSLGSYILVKDGDYNDTLRAYLDNKDTAFNDSIKSYVDNKDTQFNNSMDNWVDGKGFLQTSSGS